MITQTSYEPPLSQEGEPIQMGSEPLLADGVHGYALMHGDEVWIPSLFAKNEGDGRVGVFIDSLSARCCFVNVISARLGRMLLRRGYRPTSESTEDGEVDVWRRIAMPIQKSGSVNFPAQKAKAEGGA